MDNCIEKIKCKKEFFWKWFLVSFTAFIISFLIVMLGSDLLKGYVEAVWKLQSGHYEQLVVYCFAFWKIVIIQFTLLPAIALLIMQKCKEKKAKKEE